MESLTHIPLLLGGQEDRRNHYCVSADVFSALPLRHSAEGQFVGLYKNVYRKLGQESSSSTRDGLSSVHSVCGVQRLDRWLEGSELSYYFL